MSKKKKTIPSLVNLRVKVYNETYGDEAILCLCDKEEFEKWVLKNYGIDVEVGKKACGEFVLADGKDGGFSLLVWMPGFDWTVDSQQVLAHELIHVVHTILKKRGVDGGEGVGEAFAYLYSYFMRSFWMRLKELYEKNTTKTLHEVDDGSTPGGPEKCEDCGSAAFKVVRVVKCESCGKLYGA